MMMMTMKRLKQMLILKRERKRMMIIIIKMMMKMMKRRRKTNICLSLVVLKRRANLRLSMWNLNWYNQVRHIIILLELCLTNILMARKMRALMFLDWLIK
jgi:hypothetical protein